MEVIDQDKWYDLITTRPTNPCDSNPTWTDAPAIRAITIFRSKVPHSRLLFEKHDGRWQRAFGRQTWLE